MPLHFTTEVQQLGRHSTEAMELDLLERRIRRLVAKLAKQNIHLEVFDHEDIEYGAVLGKGGEGIVRSCKVVYNELPVEAAVKTVLNNSDDALTITLDEIELLCLARDPIITTTLQVYGVAAVPEPHDPEFGHLVIITEAGIKNTLQLYQSEGRCIPLYVTYDLWSRLAAALHCIHTKRIIHQDLKPENILVTSIIRDVQGAIDKIQFKIIDLGMGRRLVSDRVVCDDILGTNGYHAPEVLFDDFYDVRADIFMLGITFCVMLLPPSNLRRASLQSLLKKIHEAKEKRILGRSLFTSVIEHSIQSGAGVSISPAVRNMLCTMLERLDRRHVTLLDVVDLCSRESACLRCECLQQRAIAAAVAQTVPCPVDSGIDSSGDCMASQRTLRKIGLLEGHVLRQTSPRRLRSNKKRTPPHAASMRQTVSTSSDDSGAVTPVKSSDTATLTVKRARSRPSAVRRRPAVARRISVSSTSSELSRTVIKKQRPAAKAAGRLRTASVNESLLCNRRTARKSVKRPAAAAHDYNSDSESETPTPAPPVKRVLRSCTHLPH